MSEATALVTMPELLHSRSGAAAAEPDRVALCVDGEHPLTVGDWWYRSRILARGLTALGVGPGHRLALVFDGRTAPGWHDHAVGVMAGYLSGATVVGLALEVGAAELARRITAVGASGLLHGPGIEVIGLTGWSMTPEELARYGGGQPTGDAADPPPATVDVDDVAEIIHTSGTTGQAKAVAVPHGNLTFGHAGGGRLPEAGPSVLTPVGLGSNAGHSSVLIALIGTSTVHVLTDNSPASVAAALGRTGAGMVILPGPIAIALAADDLLAGSDVSAVRMVMLGSTPVPQPVAARLMRRMPQAVFAVGYGSTEAAPASTSLPLKDGPAPSGSVGRPRPGTQVEIRDEAGRALVPGRVGEVWMRSPAPPRWYLGLDDGTFAGGWTRMGDLGFLEPDGSLHVFDRAADGLLRQGARISALRIEDVLHRHPAIRAAAVVIAQGRLVAVVETTAPIAPDEVRQFLVTQNLHDLEIPDVVQTVNALPRGSLGKVLKRLLADGSYTG